MNYSFRLMKLLADAEKFAETQDCPELTTAHILWAIVEDGKGIAPSIFNKAGVNQETIKKELEEFFKKEGDFYGYK